MAKHNGMVNASTLIPRDRIEVPVEVCEIVQARRVPGQLRDRRAYLIELTVVPTSGPWANCEGTFIVESGDLLPLVKKYTRKEQRRDSWVTFWSKVKEKIFGPKVEEVPQLPFQNQMTGPMT